MRITCPHCQKSVVVADGSAGTPTPCPLCGNIFTPPALAGAALDLPPAPPPAAPLYEAPASPPASRPVAAAAATPVTHAPTSNSTVPQPCCRCVLSRDVVQWLTPAGLVLTFLLTFFTWVAAAPAGYTMFTQSAWGAAGGSFAVSVVGSELVDKRAAILNKHSGWSFWMTLYLLGLFLTTALALGDKFVPKTVVLPDVVRPVWAQRRMIVSALCVVLLLLLLIQGIAGFGLERAAVRAADEAVPAFTGPDASAPTAQQNRDLNHALEVNSYGLRRTWWFALALLAQLTAAIGVGLMQWLDSRGMKAEPWVDFYC